MITPLKGPGVDLSSTGHPLSWYEGIKAKGKTWVAIDLESPGFEADFKNAISAGLHGLLFQGYWDKQWIDADQAQERAQYAVSMANSVGYEKGASLGLDFESVNISDVEALAWLTAWANVVSDAGFEPAAYIGVPQPLTGDQIKDSAIRHLWKAFSSDTVDVPERGYAILQVSVTEDLDGVAVDLDEAGVDLLGNALIGMAGEPAKAVAVSVNRRAWHVAEGQNIVSVARAVRVPEAVLLRYNRLTSVKVGDVLSIPKEVRVRSGQTLSGIVDGLHESGITWEFIAQVNQINPNRLWVGQAIWV